MSSWAEFFAAKAEMPAPIKDTQGYGYQYATLAQVKSIIDPACAKHGIGYTQYQDGGMLYTNVVDIETGEPFIKDTREVGGNKDQERGSSETYQRRYALLTVFGLAPEDDDGQAASRTQKQGASRQDPALDAAKHRMWAALKQYAAKHGTEPERLLEGVQKRSGYAETVEFMDAVTIEFETAE